MNILTVLTIVLVPIIGTVVILYFIGKDYKKQQQKIIEKYSHKNNVKPKSKVRPGSSYRGFKKRGL